MERRFTAFLIPALVAVLAIMIFGPQPEERPHSDPRSPAPIDVPPAERAVETLGARQDQSSSIFTRDFGVPGESGFRIRFDRREQGPGRQPVRSRPVPGDVRFP